MQHFFRSGNMTNGSLSRTDHISEQVQAANKVVAVNTKGAHPENQTSVLLALGMLMAQTRNRKGLEEVMAVELAKLFYFSHSHIIVFSKDKTSFENFVSDPFKRMKESADYQNFISSNQQIDFNSCSVNTSERPIMLDFDHLESHGLLPEVLRFHHAKGIKQMVSAGLRKSNEVFGMVNFYSDVSGIFTSDIIELIHCIVTQISVAVDNILAYEKLEQKERENEILLSFSAAFHRISDRDSLFVLIKEKLSEFVSFADIAISIYDSTKSTFQVFAHDVDRKTENSAAFKKVISREYPVPDGIHEVALRTRGPVIVTIEQALLSPDRHEGTLFIADAGVKEMLLVSMITNDRVIGFLNILSKEKNAFVNTNLRVLQGITDQLATAITNIRSREEVLLRDYENETLLSVNTAISRSRDVTTIMSVIRSHLRTLIDFNDICVSYYNLREQNYKVVSHEGDLVVGHTDAEFIPVTDFPINDGIHNVLIPSKEVVCFDYEQMNAMKTPGIQFMLAVGVRTCVGIRLVAGNLVIGALVLTSNRDEAFSNRDRTIIERVSQHLATGVSNIQATEKLNQQIEEIKRYKDQLQEENLYLQEEATKGTTFRDIIGSGTEMQKVFHLLSQVSLTNSTVLILGETGTGKELIARAIHNSSGRSEKLMVKVNCAALPTNLIESELFGHEKGSFTGAHDRRIGKFELANNGTLFLDEIGEMPLELQAKILRAIQEREIERLGGNTAIKVNVRIIAATNRDLADEVKAGNFREDLYYRLNVFPINVPPLRERKEDIPTLAKYFVSKYAKNNGKKINRIDPLIMKELNAYNWPGNVRELEHCIERAVILTIDNTLSELHLPRATKISNNLNQFTFSEKTFEENERDYIVAVLNQCNGKIYGPGGAAKILDLKVGTLNSKIKKLGITKEKNISPRKV